MKSIVYTAADGSTCLCHPVVSRDDPDGFTHEDALTRAMAKDIPADATNVQTIDKSEIPADRTFRNAWTLNGKTIAHDMNKARDIHRARLRAARAPKLAKLDVDYQRADERGDMDAKQAVAAQKQALRDLPNDPAIDKAKTPEKLKALWPSDLDYPV